MSSRGWRVDLVVPAQVARVVVGHVRRPVGAATGISLPVATSGVEQLGVVHHLVVAAELRVLVARVLKQCGQVATIFRVPGSRPSNARSASPRSAGPASGTGTRCPTAAPGRRCRSRPVPRTAKLDPGAVQQLRHRAGGLLRPVLERAGAADPEQVLGLRGRARRRPPAPRSRGPWSSPRGCAAFCPHGLPLFSRFAAARRARWGTRTRSSPGSGACRRCGRRARCRPGTAPRRPRRSCRPQHVRVDDTAASSAVADQRPLGLAAARRPGSSPASPRRRPGDPFSSPARSLPPPASRYGALA